jgi:Ras-related protein Rab-18
MQSTIGVDFKLKMMRVGGKLCKVTIWDTAGQERFRTLTSSYYRGAHGIILVSLVEAHPFSHSPPAEIFHHAQVYDVTRPDSFTALGAWLKEIENYCPEGGTHVVKLLVGNKTDRVVDRAVSTKEGEAWARSKGMLFLESSAMNQDNVKAVFEEVVQKILETPALLAGTTPQAPRQGLARLDTPKPPVAEASGGTGCCA